MEDSQFEICTLTPEKILELIEQAYPNPVTAEDLAKNQSWNEEEVQQILLSLKSRDLIKAMEYNSYMRTHHEDKEVKVVKQMPTIASNKQPTIAVITAQYCEKLAVDAMLENKETFVRYTTVDSEEISELDNQNRLERQRKRRYFGESNVYTLGNVGAHRIVTTKLPSVGSTRVAMTASGNTTTRLLGTFQKVDYVFVVGVAGGVPHYTDYKRHVRLGDVVVSHPAKPKGTPNDTSKTEKKPYIYMYRNGEEVRTYYPQNDCLQQITEWIQTQSIHKNPWDTYITDSILSLAKKTNNDFNRPSPQTDKLYMNIGNREVIEVAHPQPLSDADLHFSTRLHLGPIGSGRDLVQKDSLRSEFVKKNRLLATDTEMSSVLDSIIGNCRESFILIKGITDYKDGMSNKKWQNYASVAAAAVMKSIICGMDAPTNV